MAESREEQQARTVSSLQDAAQHRTAALQAAEEATRHVRDAVLAARAAGVSVRRAAWAGEVSPDTVNTWVQQARGEALAAARHQLTQSSNPQRRGLHLPFRYPTTTVYVGRRPVRLFMESGGERGDILSAAYAHVMAGDPDLAPDPAAAESVVDTILEQLAGLPSAAPVREVLAAVDHRSMDELMARLDRAARMLLEAPREVWQPALLPHLPLRFQRATFAGFTAACQTLDAVLAGPCGGHAPGALVCLSDGELAVVTEARWTPGTDAPTGYLVTPGKVGRTETTVAADQLAPVDHQDEQ
ncbi:hypothetical protein ACWDOR_43250 [Streptosporangium canum]